MKLLIIRHGQSEADILNVWEGRADFDLTALGHEQASLMANWVAGNYKIDKIFSSPLKRAQQTADALANSTGASITFDDDLMEWQNGLIAGMLRAEALAKYPPPNIKYPHTAMYGQESDVQFRARAETALSKIINENTEEHTIAIVSHNGLIGRLFHSFICAPLISPVNLCKTGDTGIHEWRITNGMREIIHVNMQHHLAML
ncbi:MAG: histidine phosphatase family protein [Defluviitaleaceae bacterium]|nr:histidine phosphatase family protein [Defluviitaleaceae bacterium]